MLWAFLSQVFRDGKDSACEAAVADITAARVERGEEPPTHDTGDYCRARAKLAQRRSATGPAAGAHDSLITWTRPDRPDWMDPAEHQRIPKTLEVRMIRFTIPEPGRRARENEVVTTLTDAEAYSRDDIAELYGFRWNSELDIRSLKSTLNLDHLRCKTPAMVQAELWATILAYNLIRTTVAGAAALHDKQPRQISSTAASRIANRPGRFEPRVIKRRRHRYPLMNRPRAELRRGIASSQA